MAGKKFVHRVPVHICFPFPVAVGNLSLQLWECISQRVHLLQNEVESFKVIGTQMPLGSILLLRNVVQDVLLRDKASSFPCPTGVQIPINAQTNA